MSRYSGSVGRLSICVWTIVLCLLQSLAFATESMDLQRLKEQTRQEVRSLPMDSTTLHETLWRAGESFEKAGIFSQAVRYYKYLDSAWDKYPPGDSGRRRQLKEKIATLRTKQDVARLDAAASTADDSLVFYQKVYRPGQTLLCRLLLQRQGSVWLVLRPTGKEGTDNVQGEVLPVLYPSALAEEPLTLKLPKTPGDYVLSVYDGSGRFLTQGQFTILPEPEWGGKLKVETDGYPGLDGTPIRPGSEVTCLVHNAPEWVQGGGKNIWVGLYHAQDPQEGKRPINSWKISSKKQFTEFKTTIKEPGDYQLRVVREEGKERQLLLTTELKVGALRPVRQFDGAENDGPPLAFKARQKVQIANQGLELDRIGGMDPQCLIVPSWFAPSDLQHGLNHALVVNTDLKRGDGPKMELPDAGGTYDILYYEQRLALNKEATPVRLAQVRVEESVAAALFMPQRVFSPGANIRAAVRFGSNATNLRAYLLPQENLQLRADKAGYVSQKRFSLSLEAKSCPSGWCWLDMPVPLNPGTYLLALYDPKQLVAVQVVTVEDRPRQGAEVLVSQGAYLAGEPLRFKVFPPAEGMAFPGRVGLFQDEKEVKGANLYPQYMDYPLTLEAPKDPGEYELRFYLRKDAKKLQEQPVAQARVRFAGGADISPPDFKSMAPGISPEALAAFQGKGLLTGSSLAQFTLFNTVVTPDQELLLSYSIPRNLPACILMVPQGLQPQSLAQALKEAIKVHELNSAENVLTLRAPKSGDWDLCLYDTLQWAKAGTPGLITTLSFKVQGDGPERRLDSPPTALSQGDLVLRLHTGSREEPSKAERTLRLYPDGANIIRNPSAAIATVILERVIDGIFQAKLALQLEPGGYVLQLGDSPTTFPLRVVPNPNPPKKAAIGLMEKELIPLSLVTAEFSPASSWEKGWAWALAAKNASGEFQFVDPPRTVKKEQGNRVVRTALTLPRTQGEYRLCLWENVGSVDYANLPPTAVIQPLNVRLPQSYLQRHQPEVALRAYFATDDTLYAGMYTTGTYTASIDYDRSAWIGLLPASPPAPELSSEKIKKSALWSTALSGRDSGQWSFHTPEQPGDYQLVMYDGVKNGRLVLHRTISLREADLAMLNKAAEAEADAILQSLPGYEEDVDAIKKSIREEYENRLEVPQIRPVPVSPKMLQQLQGKVKEEASPPLSEEILALLAPKSACAATAGRDCEADIDLAIENMRKVNINFGDGVNVRQVVSELAVNMASDLVMGQEHVKQAKEYYDKTKKYYEQAMQLKAGVEKDGWQETVEGALWNSTQAMLNSCVTDGCLSKLGRKAIEHKLKGYNPRKMSKEEVEAWKKEYTRMVVLLDPDDLHALETQTAKFADLAGQLSVPDAGTKAKEMAKAAAINTMKSVTLSMVSKMPGWTAVKAYYETLNVLRGALIDKQTVDFMDAYRDKRDEGGTISQVNDILSAQQVSYITPALRKRIEDNPRGYLQYLSTANRALLKDGKPITLSPGEIDGVIMGYMEKWYQQEVQDKRKDKDYQEMKDAWYASDCQFEAYKAEVAKKDFFGTMSEFGGHLTSSLTGAMSGEKTFSSVTCARKALAFQNFLNLRGQIIQQMAGWQGGMDPACRLGSPQNKRLVDKLTCEAVLSPATYKAIMAANAEACGALPKPLPPAANPKFKELSKKGSRAIEVLLRVSGNTDVLRCLCNRHSVMGSSCSYHPELTKNSSPACDNPGAALHAGQLGLLSPESGNRPGQFGGLRRGQGRARIPPKGQ